MERHGWTWPSIRDPERSRARSLGATYQPHFVLLDEGGAIVDTHQGGGNSEVWARMLAKLP